MQTKTKLDDIDTESTSKEINHSKFSQLAHRCREQRNFVAATAYNMLAGLFAPDEKEEHAEGYIQDLDALKQYGDDDL